MKYTLFLKNSIFTLFIVFTFATTLVAQTVLIPKPLVPKIIPAAPNMASLGVFGEIPVGYFTGVPDISVPLYNVNFKDLNIPISIKYHNAIGNRVDLMPGSLGLGWVLFAGGSISRISKELQSDDIPGQIREHDSNPTLLPNWDSEILLNDYLKRNINILSDSAKYDAFYFNFLNFSGHIYFDHLNKPHVKSTSTDNFLIDFQFVDKMITMPLLVQGPANVPGGTAAPYSNQYFHTNLLYKIILTDNAGIKYTFGGTDESIDFVRPGLDLGEMPNANNLGTTASSWQLTSIESPNGYKIDLEYKRGDIVVSKTGYSQRKVIERTNPGGVSSDLPVDHAQTSSLTNPSYLTKIKTPQQTIDFTGSIANQQLHYPPNSAALPSVGNKNYFSYYQDIRNANTENRFSEKLDMIKISDNSGTQYRAIRFNYTDSLNTRLKLIGLDIQGTALSSNTEQQYKFEYNPTKLPGYLTFRTDHLGYFNNRIDADSLAGLAHNQETYFLSREPDSTFARAEVLKKIIYPTKGYTIFDFELNQYSSVAKKWPFIVEQLPGNQDKYGCGLRIKKISSYGNTNEIIDQRIFYYKKDYAIGGQKSSGVLSHSPIYFEELNGNLTAPAYYATYNSSLFTGDIKVRRWDTNSLNPISNTQGSPITYSEVTETQPGNGYKVYKFKNYDNGFHDIPAISYVSDHSNIKEFWKDEPGTAFDLERGQLKEESVYSALNDIRLKTTYTYNNDPLRFNEFIRVVKKGVNPLYSEARGVLSIRFTASQVFTYFPFLKEKETITFLNGNQISKTEKYTYNQNRLKKQVEFEDSDEKVKTVQYDYPSDMVALGQTVPYQAMVKENIVANVVNERYYINGVKRIHLATNYREWLKPNKLYLPELQTRQQDSSPLDTLLIFHDYDKQGNPLSFSQKDGVVVNYLWGYKKQFPIAEVKNANYSDILGRLGGEAAVNTFSDSNPNDFQINSFVSPLKSGLSNAQIAISRYNPMQGLTSQTDANDQTIYYEYDGFQRLKYIRDQSKNIVKDFTYNYRGEVAGNDNISKIFRKIGCSVGYYGQKVEYNVPANKYFEATKAEANALAWNDINAQGQQYANSDGECYQKGIYVSICGNNSRTAKIGNYQYQYVTYSIHVFSDHYGEIPYNRPVNISVNFGGNIQPQTVTTSLVLGEFELSRLYVGPKPTGTEGEFIQNSPPEILDAAHYVKLGTMLGCTAPIVESPAIQLPVDGLFKLPAQYFSTVERLFTYSNSPGQLILENSSIYSTKSLFDEFDISQTYYGDGLSSTMAVDGYYSLLETNPLEDKGYKYYHIVNGKLVDIAWSGDYVPVVVTPGDVLKEFDLFIASNKNQICLTDPFGSGAPLMSVKLYSYGDLSSGSIGAIPGTLQPLFYIDEALTIPASTGYYTKYETDQGHAGYRIYFIAFGNLMFTTWCFEADPGL